LGMRFMIYLIVPAVFALTGCANDETLSSFTAPEAEYALVSLDGVAFAETATISFPNPGEVAGQAPCNRYFASQTLPYPWFGLEGIGATRMACPSLEAEAAFFDALENMTLAEVAGDTLLLSNPSGRQMEFVAR